ncbi:Cadmium resistance transporter [Penicillium argentinense]|uniref:Cadmium resistance transporter n=1 Tax=Penicillium argentinense TaxID=1131581 RepID=A0A9W9FFZ8_9EURO|nr:Cadmium resistance transporter [Penicillium argentinense]KAJ5099446.1 Cadmium resistance transporter [Penicillium argentinense]
MQFGKAIGTACASFAITNIDDAFVLVTFFAEATTRKTITPLKITIGQCLGFTIIIMISMIGYGVSLALPSEPIGFLGLLPILLGCWNLIKLIFSTDDEDEDEESRFGSLKSVFKVALVTLMNGGDNIGTYIPLFSQAKGTEIAIYVVVYYILLFVWCLTAYLVMKQRHILRLAQKYAEYVVPFLYMGLGIYIVVKSDAYPWSIDRINRDIASYPGKVVMGVVTAGLLLICITGLGIFQWKRYKASKVPEEAETGDAESESHGNSLFMTENPATRDSQKSTTQLDVSEETQRPTGIIT